MAYELDTIIDCRLCGRLRQTHVLDRKPIDEEIAEFNKKADEDHRRLHELREIESRFERLDN